ETRPHLFVSSTRSFTSGQTGSDAVAQVSTIRLDYPLDFTFPSGRSQPVGGVQAGVGTDSLQLVLQVEDRIDNPPDTVAVSNRDSKLPFFDDIQIVQAGADLDGDGVSVREDRCSGAAPGDPTTDATGQDADGDGCVDATSTMHHVESWDQRQLP